MANEKRKPGDRSTGRVRWRARLGTALPLASEPCGNIDPTGITSTPVYDPSARLVFALAHSQRLGMLLISGVVFALMLELAQIPLPTRHARFEDFFVDAFSACLGITVAHFTRSARKQQSSSAL